MMTVIPCPECGVPAEITDRFTLPSTDGPVAHVATACAAGHCFRMPAEMLARPPRKSVRPITRVTSVTRA
jgi:hypothetical protein